MPNLLKVSEKLLQNLIGLSFLNSQSNLNAAFGFFLKLQKYFIIFYCSHLYGIRHVNDQKEEFWTATSPLCPARWKGGPNPHEELKNLELPYPFDKYSYKNAIICLLYSRTKHKEQLSFRGKRFFERKTWQNVLLVNI